MVNSLESKIQNIFLIPYLTLLSIALFLQQFLPDYFRYSKLEAISFRSEDGWCTPKTQGVGIHCFGDFYYPFTFMNLENPWKGTINPWPPFSFYVYKPLETLSNGLNPRFGIILFLLVSLIALLFPLFHLKFISKEITEFGFYVVLLITLTFAPVIVSLDRGNNIIFCIPILYLFLRSQSNEKNKASLLYLSILILFKPQFIILSLLFYYSNGLKYFLFRSLFLTLVFISSFILYPFSFPKNILDWFGQTLTFQDYGGKGMLVPPNLSLMSDINVFTNIFDLNVSESVSKGIVWLFAIVALLFCIRKSKIRTTWHNFLALIFFPILFTGTAFHYYLSIFYVVILIYVAVIFSTPGSLFLGRVKNWETWDPTLTGYFQSKFLILLSAFAFIPWGIPWSITLAQFRDRGWDAIGINWLPAQYFVMFLGFSVMFIGSMRSTDVIGLEKGKQ